MGLLAENKSRRKISTDPNNTKWTRDTTTFGQKILRSQGWQPGEYLGAKDAPHSEFHTAANASYIKVALKDDMKGLGFKKSKEDEITGLDVFSDVLSRLNGKSEESIAQDQQARLVIKTSAYVENRFGPMRFVRGGLLVGDKLKETTDNDDTSNDEAEQSADEPIESAKEDRKKKEKKDKKSKKRKAASLEEEDEESRDATPSVDIDQLQAKKRRKEERKAKKNKDESRAETSASDKDEDRKAKKREKKEKKDKVSSKDASRDEVKKSKKERKEEKKEKKEKRKRRKEAEAESESDSAPSGTATASDEVSTAAASAAGTGTSTPRGSRNFVRSRFIAQKKAAVLDTKLLNQIFMVKA